MNHVTVVLNLTQNHRPFGFKNLFHCLSTGALMIPCTGIAGEALSIARQCFRSFQVNMQIVLSEACCALALHTKQCKGSITVKIKYRKIHSNALSKWLIMGFVVSMPSGA